MMIASLFSSNLFYDSNQTIDACLGSKLGNDGKCSGRFDNFDNLMYAVVNIIQIIGWFIC
jgi:hypothetical protein